MNNLVSNETGEMFDFLEKKESDFFGFDYSMVLEDQVAREKRIAQFEYA